MKTLKITAATLILIIASNVQAEKLGDILKSVSQESSQILEKNANTINEAQQLLESGKQLKSGELTNLLVSRLGVTPQQASGGAGALLQVAKTRMNPDAFAKLSQQIPDVQQLIAAVPALKQQSGALGLAGKLASLSGDNSISNLVTAVSIFKQLGMKPEVIQKFAPVVVDYVRGNTDEAIAGGLKAALSTDKP
jgi:hypothetical protein